MSVLSLFRVEVGEVGVLPGDVRLSSTDDLVTITAPGYLDRASSSFSVQIFPTDIVTAVYGTPLINKQVFTPVITNGVITLVSIGGGGVINDGTNLGAGEGVFAAVSGDALTFKSIIAGANISVTPTGTDLTIAAVGGGGGTITDGQNIGTGTGNVFAQDSGSNLQFKTLAAGTNTSITENSNTITIANTAASGDITNASNLGAGAGVFAMKTGATLDFKSLTAGSNVTITPSGTEIQISATGGGGGGFDYVKAYWVARNGNDANDGLSIDSPKLTIQSVLTAIGADTSPTVINIVDTGVYAGPFTFPTNGLVGINGPGAILTCAVNNMFNMTGGVLNIICGGVSANNLRIFNCSATTVALFSGSDVIGDITNDVSNSTRMTIKADYQIIGDIIVTSNGSNIFESSTMIGNFIDTSPAASSYRNKVVVNSFSGNISSTNTTVYGYVPFSSGSPSITGIKQGYFNGVYHGDQRNEGTFFNVGQVNGQPYNVIEWSSAQSVLLNGTNFEDYSNCYINYTGNNGYGRFDLTNDAAVPVGFHCWMFQNVNNNQTGVESSGVGGVANIVSASTVPGVAYTRRNGSALLLVKVDQSAGVATFNVYGDLWQSNEFSSFLDTYVSKSIGSDITGTGSIEAPFASIGAAVTALGAPANPTAVFILDGETYNENVVLANPNVSLVGRAALLSPAAGDGVEVSHGVGGVLIDLGGIIIPGAGRAIYSSAATGAVVSLTDIILGDIEIAAGAGNIYMSAVQIDASMTAGAGADIYYNAAIRVGSNVGSVRGVSSIGAVGDFEVGGSFTATGLDYPTADGAYGNVITTNGSGTLTLSPPRIYFQSTPTAFIGAVIPVSASFISGRVIENTNAGPCTWTIDTGTNLSAAFPDAVLGDTFNVYVYNAPAATITLLSNTDASVIGSGSNLESFVLTLRYGGGVIWNIYI